jgi:hypothetical protein
MPFDVIYMAPVISDVEFHVFHTDGNPSVFFDPIDHSARADVELP